MGVRSILLSFDAEEFDIPLEYGRQIDPAEQLRIGGEGLERSLDLCGRLGARATFFTTVAIARAFPSLIRRIVSEGHELASHGVRHSSFVDADLLESRTELARIAGPGVTVRGFRRARLAWTDPRAILDAGYTYTASENPIWLPGRYNRLGRPRLPTFVDLGPGRTLLMIPASCSPIVRWPLFWLSYKNAPRMITAMMSRRTLAHDGHLALYFHPWELCDLNVDDGFGLPSVVRRVSGDRLAALLESTLNQLRNRPRVEFARYADLDDQARAGRLPRPARVAPPEPRPT
jgi:hypothetical protein